MHRVPSKGTKRDLSVPVVNRRAGMTMIEILVAVGLLGVGMMGICALLPVSIRNTSQTVNKSVAASVAQTALSSLRQSCLNLSPEAFDSGDFATISGAARSFSLNGQDATLSEAIYQYDEQDGNTVSTDHGFQLPQDLAGEEDLHDGNVVFYGSGQNGYGWSATLIPQEQPVGPDTTYTLQIAVWRSYRLIADGITGHTQTNGASRFHVTGSAPSDFWDAVGKGDCLRLKSQGVWYRISRVDEEDRDLIVSGDLPNVGPHSPCEVASQFRLVGLYTSTVGGG
jgi:prepilin-type N-terminal cleavage/methylation domain-containing protein